MRRVVTIVGIVMMAAVGSAAAQQPAQPSLADVAREAEAAKATAKKARKSYTNADLGAVPEEPKPADTPPPAGFVSAATGKVVTADELIARSEEKVAADEKANTPPEEYWRKRADHVRLQVEKTSGRLERLKGRPQNPNATLQQKAEQEITTLQATLATLQKSWAKLASDARDAKINLSWLEPVPQFPEASQLQ